MADQRSRGGQKKGMSNPNDPAQHQGVHPGTTSNDPAQEAQRELERRKQNRDDPSRAPESGDRK